MSMNWISTKTELPPHYEDVIVWVIYHGEDDGSLSTSWTQPDKHEGYIDPYSGGRWMMGSAHNYKVTHWAKIEGPTD